MNEAQALGRAISALLFEQSKWQEIRAKYPAEFNPKSLEEIEQAIEVLKTIKELY